jgi:PTH1 family peptidyl-tRNA hydrolase
VGDRVVQELERLAFKSNYPDIGLLRPQKHDVYMNSCGPVVAREASDRGIKPQEILVVCDDFAIPLGRRRIRLKGSSGGHNGLDSILQALQTQDVPRLRVGIGPVPQHEDPADFVLETFSKDEKLTVTQEVSRAAEAVLSVIIHGLETAMNEFNGTMES